MSRLNDAILRHKNAIFFATLAAALLCAAAIPLVQINYSLSDYLPDHAPSTMALRVMENSFSDQVPNTNVYIPDVSIPEALTYKKHLEGVSGVSSVLWLDDVADIYQPLEMQDTETVEAWYKNSGALFLLTADTEDSVAIMEDIREIAGKDSILLGEAVNHATIQSVTMEEVSRIMFYVVPVVLLILLITTSSWFEPVLFLIVIGVAILLNEGTNLFLPDVSYVTQATSAVLQLAVSIDYAVFLLHSFARFREENIGTEEAMKKAMDESASAIAASAATTVFGFLALTLMNFKIGPNMGAVLAKGVVFSYLSVMVLLPVLAIRTTKLMDKTTHRSFLPSFDRFGKVVIRICMPLAGAVLLLMVPSFLAQRNNAFLYGSEGVHSEDSKIRADAEYVHGIFGEIQQMVLLVPDGDVVKESSLAAALKQVPNLTSVIAYSNTVGAQIPPEFLSEDQISQFRAEGYSRLILGASTSSEGEEAFALVKTVREIAKEYYGDTYHLLGQNVVNYDLKATISGDNLIVNAAAIIAIGVVLLITFRNIFIPLILLLTIEGAIWINLGIPYFTGSSLNYIGYQIISAVQLGATVDYGILFAQKYLNNRKSHSKYNAACMAVSDTSGSILTPASILATSGALLGVVSSNGVISQLGMILGRGAVISSGMVLFFLPALLILFDGAIQKTEIQFQSSGRKHTAESQQAAYQMSGHRGN
ncbi:MAG TPA: MMPL family transporter [Firmicutes bacterium]|jgi:predicted RND superfamily exporter protein|nr:MMPL family transporter [Bacillota bacterium]